MDADEFLVCGGIGASRTPLHPGRYKAPPMLSYPFQVQMNAMSSAGATVAFSVSASDSLSGLVGGVTVSPFGSGATFPIGTTHETVMATDAAGNLEWL